MHVVAGAATFGPGDGARYVEHLRVPAMSLGTYSLRVGAGDPQGPHTEDEVYVVVSGRAVLEADTGRAEATPGTMLFVPAERNG